MTEPETTSGHTRPRVLVVEDVDLNRELLEQLLEDTYDVRSAADGEAALAEARAWRPHVVLLDLSLPKLDGWAVARLIRNDRELASMRVVALTAHAMCGERETALAAGCDAYLTKPVDEATLLEVVRRAVEAAR